jgi:hypothetical protein
MTPLGSKELAHSELGIGKTFGYPSPLLSFGIFDLGEILEIIHVLQ